MGFVRDITGKTARKQAQKSAQEAAAAEQKGAQTQAEWQKQALEYMKEQAELPTEIRNQALQQLQGMFGLDGMDQAAMIQQAQESPLFEAMMGGQAAGEEALMRQAAATGGLRGGNVQGALAQQASNLRNQALLQSYAEQQRLQQQRIGGLQGLAGLGTGAGQIASMMGGIGQTLGAGQAGAGRTLAQGQIAGEQARQQALGSLLQTGGQLASLAFLSDRRLKTNIRKLGSIGPVGWYSWDWLPESGISGGSAGFMSDEVEIMAPDAVITGSDGYKRVYYRRAFEAAKAAA